MAGESLSQKNAPREGIVGGGKRRKRNPKAELDCTVEKPDSEVYILHEITKGPSVSRKAQILHLTVIVTSTHSPMCHIDGHRTEIRIVCQEKSKLAL